MMIKTFSKLKGFASALAALAVMAAASWALADVPDTFTFDAHVFEAGSDGGFSYDGTVRVDLFNDPDFGSSLWNETHAGMVIEGGFLTLDLGSVNTGTLPAVLIAQAGTPLYFELRLQGIGYTFPVRLPVSSVPYALVCSEAGNAETFQNMEPSAFSMFGHSHAWGLITGKPTEFTPSAHDHTTSDISDWPTVLDDSQISWNEVQSKPSTFTPSSHDHSWSDISDVPGDLEDGEISWSEVNDKPITFDAAPHDHAWVEITSIPGDLADGEISWSEVTSKPTEFTPAAHDHNSLYYTETELDGFLSGKAAVGASYTKAQSDANYLPISGKAADSDKLDGEDSAYFATQGGLDTTNTNLDSLSGDLSTNYYSSSDLNGGQLDARYYTESECAALFAGKSDTYTKTEVDDAIAAALAALKDCPASYEKVTDGSVLATGYYCAKGSDEMVKVGNFWVDRYEASIWQNADCTGTRYGGDSDNWTSSGATGADADLGFFPRNGNWTTKLYSCSATGVKPSRWHTWFQAEQACLASGKYLCTNAEWQAAASGTDISECNTGGSGEDGYNGSDPENAGSLSGPAGTGCMSNYGTYDQVGNVWEWTAMWTQAGPDNGHANGWESSDDVWPDGYGNDHTWNVTGASSNGDGWSEGAPASALRGGPWHAGSEAGVFALALDGGPAGWTNDIGARCCRR